MAQKPAVPKKLVVLPESDLKVREIPRKGQNGIGYCSLSKNFKSGQTLFLSRDASMSNTIAIDFQNDILEVGRQYAIMLRTGEVNKKITAIAATPKIIIMKTGVENDIYDEFVKSKKASFRIGADNLEFKFSNSIIDALNKLTDCATALKTGDVFRGREIAKSEGSKSDSSFEKVVTSKTVEDSKSSKTPPLSAAEKVKLDEAKITDRISPKRDEVAEIASRLVNKKGYKAFLQKKEPNTAKLNLLASPNQIASGITEEDLESIRQEALKEELEQKKRYNELAKVVKALKRENQRLMEDNKSIKAAMKKQSLQTNKSQEAVNMTKKELLEEINELRKTQRMMAMQDAELQKSSHTVLLDTQNRQMEIITEINRLREENAKLKMEADTGNSSNKVMIAKNKAEMDRLKQENLQLSLQQELEGEVRKKQELKNEMEKNKIRSELMRLKSENAQLAMDFETGKSDIVWKTEQLKQQQIDIAKAAQQEWENNKDFALIS